MGASNMMVQPSNQPTGKGGGPSFSQAQLNKALGEELAARPGTSFADMAMYAGKQFGVSPMQVGAAYLDQAKKPSSQTGQPAFGKPNRYATTQWDQASFGAPKEMPGAGGKGKGGGASMPSQPAYVAPTKFDVKFKEPGWATKEKEAAAAPSGPSPSEQYYFESTGGY